MRLWRFPLSCFVALLLSARMGISCGLNWSPHDPFDGVDVHGNASCWISLGKISFGKDLSMPLNIHFSSGAGLAPSPFLGTEWRFPLLESRAVAIDTDTYEIIEPTGRSRLFLRDRTAPTIFNGQGDWKGQLSNARFTAWATCGWKLSFEQGRLVEIGTPGNQLIKFRYPNDSSVEIAEGGEVKLRLDFQKGGSGFIKFEDESFEIKKGETPWSSSGGQNDAAASEPALTQIANARTGATWQIGYGFWQESQRQVTMKEPEGATRQIAWDPVSRMILRDNEWTYAITAPSSRWENARILRTRSGGEKEYWYEDRHHLSAVSLQRNGSGRARWNYEEGVRKGLVREERTLRGGVLSIYRPEYDQRGNTVGGASYSLKIGNADPLVELTRVIEGLEQHAVAQHRLDATADGVLLEARTEQLSDKIRIKRAEDGALSLVFENPK